MDGRRVDAAPDESTSKPPTPRAACLAMVQQQRLAQRLGYRRSLTGAVALFVLGLLACAAAAVVLAPQRRLL
ncbi:hypothetical protein PY257_03970 [Ramlibacter sp. H39-3-26]|uniref:hypothetical protein n=1 Tax=Curvibacter soli TaxID=3031331 RepID=UPI0023DC444C|nr:hypothetical protein [Ramlibacter sp. H39-3-26]MDF1484343.1 hypothetical protein [Ramlibacter sp. H39-3-26]